MGGIFHNLHDYNCNDGVEELETDIFQTGLLLDSCGTYFRFCCFVI